ncbi:para-nitrobenzyl esterase [Culex quinquefasciatus]|uniref:Carboxylic ester hydrolase n=1 Tax=Culex quinquefasciatus TaxID=7176 RepID=B0WLA5_CULQU|nr:para-nitrobenzyl esterase [Culex quinquefasciatus]|eukprot:XP_001849489.1 para-nitrobenzyl esterase [Culex quinquefasciatus]
MPMEDSLLQLSAGKIRGRKDTLPNGESYYFYKGIPYAQQPLGNLRFKPPVPLDKFEEDVLDCGYERNSCHSLICVPPVVAVGEDCLHANVYTPLKPANVDQGRRLPVMVWIHGGAFNAGSGDSSWYCPRFLVQEGVVVVTFNYRIGPLGFLCLPSKGIHGNMGLKDQRLLLKWVHDNIAQFGGDSGNVTLFGESAGGASVHLHYLTESSRQYFHRAICQSGTAINVWVEQQERDTKTRILAQLLGCIGTSDDEIYETLRNASAFDLTTHSEDCMSAYDRLCFRYFPFTPTVESDDSEEPFITEHYVDALKKPFKTHIPLISGFTSNEAIAMIPFVLHAMDCYATDLKSFVPPNFPVKDEKIQLEVGKEIRNFYLENENLTVDNLSSFLNFMSDCSFIIPTYVASELHARFHQSTPQFCYRFNFVTELNFLKLMSQQGSFNFGGASHGDDIFYLFKDGGFVTPPVEAGTQADKLRHVMCRLWTNFAKFGDPTPPSDSELGFTC